MTKDDLVSKDTALKLAIDFMETLTIDVGIKTWNEKHRKEAINACKEALATNEESSVVQPAQGIELEWYNKGWTDANFEWQGLTDDEIGKLFDAVMANDKISTEFFGIEFARAIEAKLKEKNT
jgi:hypothetical protein